ncbi:MAG: hypothetical protein IPJ07_25810 [Acidobacteria bacterium]|nr:hypothetical protein [Acidobacteriota bacterium]
MKEQIRDKAGLIILCLTLTAIAVLPFFYLGEVRGGGCCGGAMPVTHDGAMHLNQMQGFWRGLTSGRIYPRWDDLTHSGFGAPLTSFYPPGVYYLTSLLFAFLRDWQRVQISVNLILFALSGFVVYLYARQRMGGVSSLLVMAIYIIAPYHLLNLYQRGALAEQSGFIWMPLILLFADRLMEISPALLNKKTMLNMAGLSACFGAWLWTHPPTAYQMVLVFGLALLIYSGAAALMRKPDEPNIRGLMSIIVALVFGTLPAAAYFYPAIFERNLVNSDDIEISWPYHASYVFDYDQKIYDRINDRFFVRIDRIWALNLAILLLAGLVVYLFRHRLKSESLKRGAWIWFLAGGLATFLMTRPSSFIGRLIPGIESGVFSWRMLTITSMTSALLAGLCFEISRKSMEKESGSIRLAGFVASIVIMAGTLVAGYQLVAQPTYRVEAFRPRPDHFNFATLPKEVPRVVPTIERASLISGKGIVGVEIWQPEYRKIVVNMESIGQLQIRTSYFAGWAAMIDGQISQIRTGNLNEILINAPVGSHVIELNFKTTPVRMAGNILSCASIGFLIIFVLFVKRRDR